MWNVFHITPSYKLWVSWETKYLSHRNDGVESYFGGLGTPLRTQFVRMWKMFGNPKYWPIIIAFSWYRHKPLLHNSISLFGLYYLRLIEIHFHHFQTFTYPTLTHLEEKKCFTLMTYCLNSIVCQSWHRYWRKSSET